MMVPYEYQEFIKQLTSLVESGEVPMGRIDDAVGRILRVKFVAGLFESPFSDTSLLAEVGCKVIKILEIISLLQLVSSLFNYNIL